MKLTEKEITELQKDNGIYEIQELINNGNAWMMEGSVGRYAMDCLRSGACFLPKKPHKDYYGNRIPSRDMIKEGTMGSLSLSSQYWTEVFTDYLSINN